MYYISNFVFNLYINDLVLAFKDSGLGLDIDGEHVCLLLFADDIVCLADNESDLQSMLNILHDWCKTWNMKVNVEKTRAMHFRGTSVEMTNTVFKYGDSKVEIVPQYKYLGLLLTETLDYKMTASMIAKSAARALGLLVTKSKANGGMPYGVFSHLYDSLVQPIIDYGAAVWGTQEFSCISAIQNRACRFFMGVGKYTPNAAVQGDMGWKLAPHRQWIAVTRHWCRLVNMENGRLNKRIFLWAYRVAGGTRKNWCWRIKKFYREIGLPYLEDIGTPVVPSAVINDVNLALSELYVTRWQEQVTREDSIRGTGHNKLRTYCKYKQSFSTEPYLKLLNKSHRSALARFRCGVAPIRIETGRYEQLYLNDRKCLLCQDDSVESEEHVILRCDAYSDIRDDLFAHIRTIYPQFSNLSDIDRLSFILSSHLVTAQSALACHNILQQRRNLLMIFLPSFKYFN